MQPQDAHLDDMTTLTSVTNTAFKRGYTENFQIKKDGMFAPSTGITYLPNEVKIDNFYRFEGASNPDDNAILYLVETHDGIKGMLVDSYGNGADKELADFVKEIPEVPKTRPGGDSDKNT